MSVSERDLRRALLNAIRELKENSPRRNFVESIELQIGIKDVDLNRPENRFRLNLKLPYPISKRDKIGFFADDAHATNLRSISQDGEITVIDRAKIEEMRSNPKLLKKIAKQVRLFLASQSLMGVVAGSFGRILSPRNKMPIPVSSNVDLDNVIEEARKTLPIRLHKSPSINVKIGHRDMSDEELLENAMAVINAIRDKLPKGFRNISSITLKTTMGPPFKINLRELIRKKRR